MTHSLTIAPARVEEWPAALDLLFQHLPPEQRHARALNTRCLLECGELWPAGFMLAHQNGGLAAALVCLPLKGAGALFWPPQVATGYDSASVADPLVRHALTWLDGGGAKLAQAFISSAEMPLIAPLLRCGFRHVTRLEYFRHDLGHLSWAKHGDLEIEPFGPGNRELFQKTLLRTYEGTLDCPELNGRRTIEEIIEGHQHQGKFRPDLWWLARLAGQPVGVMILTDLSGWQGWDLSYVGVVPEARRRGVGLALTQGALHHAQDEGAPQLSVAVDARNRPARQLYEKLGFIAQEQREILLFFFDDLAANDS